MARAGDFVYESPRRRAAPTTQDRDVSRSRRLSVHGRAEAELARDPRGVRTHRAGELHGVARARALRRRLGGVRAVGVRHKARRQLRHVSGDDGDGRAGAGAHHRGLLDPPAGHAHRAARGLHQRGAALPSRARGAGRMLDARGDRDADVGGGRVSDVRRHDRTRGVASGDDAAGGVVAGFQAGAVDA